MDESEAGPGAWRSLAIQVTSKVALMTPTSATISADPTRPDPTRPDQGRQHVAAIDWPLTSSAFHSDSSSAVASRPSAVRYRWATRAASSGPPVASSAATKLAALSVSEAVDVDGG